MSQISDQVGDAGLAPVGKRLHGFTFAIRSAVYDAPDGAALLVTTGVSERNLVMANDAVIEICDVQRAVGPELDVHRPKPGIVTAKEVGLKNRLIGRAVTLQAVVIDS